MEYIVHHESGPVAYPNIIRASDQALLEASISGVPALVEVCGEDGYKIIQHPDGWMEFGVEAL